MPDELVRKLNPFVLGASSLNLARHFWVLVLRPFEAPREPQDMSVHYNAAGNPRTPCQHHIGVFRATPGSVSISSIVRGTSPPNFSTMALLAPIPTSFCFEKICGRISCSSSAGFAYANAFAFGYSCRRFRYLIYAHVGYTALKGSSKSPVAMDLRASIADRFWIRFIQPGENGRHPFRIGGSGVPPARGSSALCDEL